MSLLAGVLRHRKKAGAVNRRMFSFFQTPTSKVASKPSKKQGATMKQTLINIAEGAVVLSVIYVSYFLFAIIAG